MTETFVLFVGDVTEDLSVSAKNFDSLAYLIDSSNVSNKHRGTAYVSIGDLPSIGDFFNLLLSATKIIYCPPLKWSDNKTSKDPYSAAWLSEHYIRLVSNLYQIPTDNLPNKITGVEDPLPRASESRQLWVVGCSTTHGTGVNVGERYQDIIKQNLNLESTDLSYPGTSISWARDQILKSDIKKDDIVIWGLTTMGRFSWFDNDILSHVSGPNYYKLHPDFDKVVPFSLLECPHRMYEAVSSVQQVNNFCNKIGAHLIIANIHGNIDLLSDFAKYKGFVMIHGTRGLNFDSNFLDLGSDQSHPGPKTHRYYADMILEKINNLNIGTK